MTDRRITYLKWLLFSIVFAGILFFSYSYEGRLLGHLLVVSLFLIVFLLCRAISLGVVTAAFCGALVIMSIFLGSKFKFWLTARRLHPHDIYLYFNLDSLINLDVLYPKQYIFAYIVVALILLSLFLLIWWERFIRPTKWVFLGILSISVFYASLLRIPLNADNGLFGGGNRFMHFDTQHVSTFILTSLHTVPDLLAGKVFDYGPDMPLSAERIEYAKQEACKPAKDAPNLYLIMRESGIVPSTVPAMQAPYPGLDDFKSSDGRNNALRVETHGAGSAHTIFSALTGLSADGFGVMKNIGIDLSTGELHAAIPQILAKCGYQTVAITTGFAGYVLERAFYKSVDFEKYFDIQDLKAFSGGDTSDRSVFAFASSIIPTLDPNRPVFLYVDTTEAHWPYTNKLRPNEEVPQAKAINAEAVEYLRRLILGEQDFQRFVAAAKTSWQPGMRRTLITDFGDHHPSFTKNLPGRDGSVDYSRKTDDELLITFFRMTSIGFALPAMPTHPLVDAPFLGDWMLHASGLTVGGIYAQRWQMIEHCKSRYWQCDNENAAYEMHQTMRAASLITIP